MTSHSPSLRIRALNDLMRQAGPSSERWMMTAGVLAQGPEFMMRAVIMVQTYSAFDDSNDPYGEHDFGAFELAGQRLFWKIDYYDLDLRYGSDDPADQTVTARVLTLMLASEY
jgi:hypothetical protein